MNVDYVRNEIARIRMEIRRQENEIEMLRRQASTPHLQNCYLRGCAQRWMIFVTDERSFELSLRGKARDKLSTVQFPAHDCACDQADARAGDQALHLWVSRRKNVNAGLAQNVAQSGCLMGLGQT
jgi:hypothetical protein